ncbi:uncharacterized protein [Dermacentor andersoni]|uniref:uncharacterized protein n=1 Tax=Dermacentor andersoni TaxID=34620 RepID=UPI00241731EE|nr:uncharacterized protein LOC126528622 [Dermacentor andersoni]
MIEFRGITFRKRTAKALGRLIERNRSLAFLTVHLDESDPDVDYVAQLRGICRELKEALLRNRFVVNIEIYAADRVRSNQPVIRDSLRRNAMLVNEAVRFVKGSMEKNDALAFETLEHCLSLQLSLRMDLNLSLDSALEKITEARERLAFNYFILAGVVKAKIVCGSRRKKKTTFDKLGKDMQARICSYLSLNDVMDI